MLTLDEIATKACALMGLDDTPSREQAKEFTRKRWKLLWGAELWPQTRMVSALTLVAGADTLALAATMEFATLVRGADGTTIPVESEIAAMLSDADAFRANPGTPMFWSGIEPDAGLARIRFSHAPTADTAVTVVGKRTCPDLAADSDKPTIPGADLALLAHTEADLYEWMRQVGKSQTKRQEAVALVQEMRDQALGQAAQISRFIPWDESDFSGATFPYSK